jgi:glycine/D-amino acid oxidase-like deaminating enzyme
MTDKDGNRAGTAGEAEWHDPEAVSAVERPALTFDVDVDVCVIGGGLAGLTAAREVARRGWSVALLEAQRIGWNASGRNCGFVVPGFAQRIDRVVERVGLDYARVLWQLSQQGLDYVRRTIRDTRMPGVHPVPGWLDVSRVDSGDELLELDELLGQDFGVAVEGWPVEKVRDHLQTDHYFHGLYFPHAFHIHAGNYVAGLAAAAEAAGARLFERTSALTLDPAGIRKRITTPQAMVRASQVVLAGGAAMGTLVPDLASTLLSVTSHVAVTAPFDRDRLSEAITFEGGVSDSHFAGNHHRLTDNDRLLWSSGMTIGVDDPRRWSRRLQAAIEEIYPQLGSVKIEAVRSASMSYAVHGMPQIGEVSPGVWLANAFGGHGINTTAMAGDLIARAIVERDDTWLHFLPYNLVWAGGSLGRAVTRTVYAAIGARDRFRARMSRRREAVRRESSQAAE